MHMFDIDYYSDIYSQLHIITDMKRTDTSKWKPSISFECKQVYVTTSECQQKAGINSQSSIKLVTSSIYTQMSIIKEQSNILKIQHIQKHK